MMLTSDDDDFPPAPKREAFTMILMTVALAAIGWSLWAYAWTPALGETLTCSVWQKIATCTGPGGYVSHETTWQGYVYGDDSWGNRWLETTQNGRKTLMIKPGTRQK
jgi:hypothetical protein